MHNVGLGAATETLRKEERRHAHGMGEELLPQTQWADEQAYERPSAMLIRSGSIHAGESTTSIGRDWGKDGGRGRSGAMGRAGSPLGAESPRRSTRDVPWLSRRTQQSEHAFRLQVMLFPGIHTLATVVHAPMSLGTVCSAQPCMVFFLYRPWPRTQQRMCFADTCACSNVCLWQRMSHGKEWDFLELGIKM
jgi:hypothetical protein